MSAAPYRYLYGPVPSRRLGRSLGVDLVPFKTCTYDCVYCQLGRTTDKTVDRRAYVAAEPVLAELERWLLDKDRPDFITLAGSGEPTLNTAIGAVIGGIKRQTDIPVAVLTNGSLLWMDEVREALGAADVVIPSLDVGDAFLFHTVNRPHGALSFERMVEGLRIFTRGFRGEVWLEVMLLAGVTGLPNEVKKIAALAKTIGAAKVQLNTVTRPPAEAFACPLAKAQMHALKGFFEGAVDVIGEGCGAAGARGLPGAATDADILALLRRRPCTVQGIAEGLALAPNEVLKRVQRLAEQGKVRPVRKEDALFYGTARNEERGTP